MKEFACGDVIPGCSARFRAATDDELLAQIATHAHDDHDIGEITEELVRAVREHIRVAAPAH